jgi:hypothetical protein
LSRSTHPQPSHLCAIPGSRSRAQPSAPPRPIGAPQPTPTRSRVAQLGPPVAPARVCPAALRAFGQPPERALLATPAPRPARSPPRLELLREWATAPAPPGPPSSSPRRTFQAPGRMASHAHTHREAQSARLLVLFLEKNRLACPRRQFLLPLAPSPPHPSHTAAERTGAHGRAPPH